MNRVTLLGNLGMDPELRRTKNQTVVCRFRLATSERRKDAQGNWKEFAEWHNVVTFSKTAESCVEYLRKGRQVFVDGRLRTRTWQDPEGQTRHVTEIVAANVQFIRGKAPANGGPAAGHGPEASLPDPAHPAEAVLIVEEDDIPW